ncbi:MAG: 50S ribosomal protein L25 [Bdellovibrionota bacterium]
MSQQELVLEVGTRKAGKSACRKLRKKESIPGIIYGAGKKNVPLFAEEKWVRKYASGAFENSIITLKSADSALNGTKVLFKEVIVQPVTRRPLHFDFLAIDMNKEVRVLVELRFEGKAEGTRAGGTLQPIVRQIEVECLPSKIPEYIAIDVTPLHIGQALHIKEITLPDGVRATAVEDIALVTVNVIKEEEIAAPTAAAAAPAAGAPAAGAAPAAAPAKKDDKK